MYLIWNSFDSKYPKIFSTYFSSLSKNVGNKKQNQYTLFDDDIDEDSKEGKWNIDKLNSIIGQHENKGTPFFETLSHKL